MQVARGCALYRDWPSGSEPHSGFVPLLLPRKQNWPAQGHCSLPNVWANRLVEQLTTHGAWLLLPFRCSVDLILAEEISLRIVAEPPWRFRV